MTVYQTLLLAIQHLQFLLPIFINNTAMDIFMHTTFFLNAFFSFLYDRVTDRESLT